MSSSDFGDSDDDDELLQALIQGRAEIQGHQVIPTQANVPTQTQQGLRTTAVATTGNGNSSAGINDDIQTKLYRADGEISILRMQLQQLQQQKQQEVIKLNDSYTALKRNNEEQIVALKQAVSKLEDEKKFLHNELVIASASKKRKVNNQFDVTTSIVPATTNESVKAASLVSAPAPATATVPAPAPSTPKPRIIKPSNDAALFSDQIWNYCILGSTRTSLSYLSKICTDFDLELTQHNFKLLRRTPISSSIMELLMSRKSLRLDQLIQEFVTVLLEIIDNLLNRQKSKSCLAVPFLLSLVHCSITFRPVAVSVELIGHIVIHVSNIAKDLSYLVSEGSDLPLGLEDEFMNYHDVPNHVSILQKFIFVCCMDILEKAITLSSMYEAQYIRNTWNLFPLELFNLCLPQNPERFKNTAQVNLVYNMVEMLLGSITDDTFAFNNSELNGVIISSLLKVCLIELPIRENFMVYGLNRIVGNNYDLKKIDSMVPIDHDCLNNYVVVAPQPIPYELLETPGELQYELSANHQFHLLTLSVKVSELLHSLIVTQETIDFLYNREHFKSMIRIVAFEQDYIMRSPRSKYIYLRIQLVSNFVKIINYLTQQEGKDMTELIFPETMHELFVVLSRIAFGSDSSTTAEGQQLLFKVREKGYYNQVVFNETCESRARELNHLTDIIPNGKYLADLQTDFANGLEFPYESDAIECAREILNKFVTHEEADNLYFNMNCEHDSLTFDEMELVE
ncbi:uncharacterized protein SPAPADRAFT_132508 [Spathaspora passalidarum NRRL Y-27907]|uniref:DNA damage checkpoint protein LCD1 n=1 Tax=Spathaspora passalidarum (strain NRRL Y-27907 / 11-Y1) TaxID=619300 RepID=G3AFY7_SPAPN|nr:uncharacterized protein SPAPADRAFT_132508 [Spathaspora passalidarum NRRL Y-27907]EGW35126.1 hypothetical protein SPAPADRAFT_132508 [Spathaspora passalidarum NRRL Y-27907]